jgi:hypothetical protein
MQFTGSCKDESENENENVDSHQDKTDKGFRLQKTPLEVESRLT